MKVRDAAAETLPATSMERNSTVWFPSASEWPGVQVQEVLTAAPHAPQITLPAAAPSTDTVTFFTPAPVSTAVPANVGVASEVREPLPGPLPTATVGTVGSTITV